jgi:hypothetical protein
MRTATIKDIDNAIKRRSIFKEAEKNLAWYEKELVKVGVEKMSKNIGLEPMDNGDSLADYYADRPEMFR